MRVFLSSTVYDLLDVRAELQSLLHQLGVSPVLSDQKLSDFNWALDSNSIETCLLNVDASDIMIVILDQRYGPRLGGYGFEDVSATHLEYRRAKAANKPIHFYVRDRLEADFNVYRKNRDANLAWVKENDRGLFELLQEHRELNASRRGNNWIAPFTSSIDLKDSVRKQFEPVIKPQVLLNAIQQNRFPLFSCDVEFEEISLRNAPKIKLVASLRNVGMAPAFDLSVQWQTEGSKMEVKSIVAPGESWQGTILSPRIVGDEMKIDLHLTCTSAIGVTVHEQYRVSWNIHGGRSPAIVGGARLTSRRYVNSEIPKLVIDDI